MKKQLLRRLAALCMAGLTLWAVTITVGSTSVPAAIDALKHSGGLSKRLLRWELGDFFGTDQLSAVTVLALQQSPLLLTQRSAVAALMASGEGNDDNVEEQPVVQPDPVPPNRPVSTDDLTFAPNGVPSQTVIPSSSGSYTVINGVYIKNASSRSLDGSVLGSGNFSAQLTGDGPQVLILHTHGSEAYSMPAGQEYTPSGTFRTTDANYNVVRVGDEIASVLSGYGISVLHDRTLHDHPSYNDGYSNSYASAVSYLEKYPTLTYILDIHRDAIQDADGNQYKLVSREDPNAAQCCIVMGTSYDAWQDNLTLAVSVQETIQAQSPTLMRPMTVRNYSYNQQLSTGYMLVEIGAAGNSLDEAILGARLFAKGFADTITQ
ncbi:MAG: stage II sporulation protein P [Oscillospiraceae bacterium]|nr:stage II sporulation protein P [Oscillospiraceae bacterium]